MWILNRRLKPTAKDKALIYAFNQFNALSFAVHFSEKMRAMIYNRLGSYISLGPYPLPFTSVNGLKMKL
jgi:hypothetical protein